MIVGAYCLVGGSLQKYDGAGWADYGEAIKGEKGEKGDQGIQGARNGGLIIYRTTLNSDGDIVVLDPPSDFTLNTIYALDLPYMDMTRSTTKVIVNEKKFSNLFVNGDSNNPTKLASLDVCLCVFNSHGLVRIVARNVFSPGKWLYGTFKNAIGVYTTPDYLEFVTDMKNKEVLATSYKYTQNHVSACTNCEKPILIYLHPDNTFNTTIPSNGIPTKLVPFVSKNFEDTLLYTAKILGGTRLPIYSSSSLYDLDRILFSFNFATSKKIHSSALFTVKFVHPRYGYEEVVDVQATKVSDNSFSVSGCFYNVPYSQVQGNLSSYSDFTIEVYAKDALNLSIGISTEKYGNACNFIEFREVKDVYLPETIIADKISTKATSTPMTQEQLNKNLLSTIDSLTKRVSLLEQV